MRKLLLAAVGATALATASMANAAITVNLAGTTSGSTQAVTGLDNTGMPETFNFSTTVNSGQPAGTYSSSLTFSNDLVGNYVFGIITTTGKVTLEQVLNNGTSVLIASAVGSSGALTLTTPNLLANTVYKFTYTGDLTANGQLSGNAAFNAVAVPEPATWALMLLGFAGIGFAMRRRARPSLAQVA